MITPSVLQQLFAMVNKFDGSFLALASTRGKSDSEQLSHCETKADRLLDKEDVRSGKNGENGIGKVDAAREAK